MSLLAQLFLAQLLFWSVLLLWRRARSTTMPAAAAKEMAAGKPAIPATPTTPAKEATMAIDWRMYPGIMDRILYFSSGATLEQFAQTSKHMRKKVLDHFLPIRRLIIINDTAILGVSSKGDAVYLEGKHVRRHRLSLEQVDLLAYNPGAIHPALQRLLPTPPLRRFLIHRRTDVWATSRVVAETGAFGGTFTVTYPWSFQTHWIDDTGPFLHLDSKERITALVSDIFSLIPRTTTEPAFIAILMLEQPNFTYVKEDHDAFYQALVASTSRLLRNLDPHPLDLDPVRPFKIEFVNIEPWLQLRHPGRNSDELLFDFRMDVNLSVYATGDLDLVETSFLTFGINFMTLDEFKAKVGEAEYELHTKFESPSIEDANRLKDNE